MFGKKKDNQPKVKVLTPREILTDKIEAEIESLTAGQALIYQLPKVYNAASCFQMVELNPTFPEKGKKYLMYTDGIVDDRPAGKKKLLMDSNKALVAAEWISQCDNNYDWGPVKRIQ